MSSRVCVRARSALEVFPVDDLLVSDAFHPGNLNLKSQSPRRPGSRRKGRTRARGVCVPGPSVCPPWPGLSLLLPVPGTLSPSGQIGISPEERRFWLPRSAPRLSVAPLGWGESRVPSWTLHFGHGSLPGQNTASSPL